MSSPLPNMKPLAITTDEEAFRIMRRIGENVEAARQDLATLYASVPGGTQAENSIGECLTKVRAASTRIRKAVGELAQAELPLE